MEPKLYFFLDTSGSTGGNKRYWKLASQILDRYIAEHGESSVLPVIWNDTIDTLPMTRLRVLIDNNRGRGGTYPSLIAQYLRRVSPDSIVAIVTDGQIPESEIDQSDKHMGSMAFERVDIHLISTDSFTGSLNMSVSCPFTRSSSHTVDSYEENSIYPSETKSVRVSKADIALVAKLDEMRTIAEFMEHYAEIERVIVARTMGTTGNIPLRDRLLELQRRLVADASSQKTEAAGSVSAFIAAVRAGSGADAEDAVNLMKKLTAEYYYSDSTADIAEYRVLCARLISMCQGSLRSAFSTDDIARVARAPVVDIPDIEMVDSSSSADATVSSGFTCPIMISEDDAVILVTAGTGIFHDLSKEIVQQLINCPLAILGNSAPMKKALDAFKTALDHPIGLVALKAAEAVQRPIRVSPMTRATVIASAGIFLGASEEHCQASRFAFSEILTGTSAKLVGNADLWFAVLYILVRSGQIPYLEPIMPQIAAQMRWRLRNHSTFATLQGAPEFVTTRLPLDVAIWYVAASPVLELPAATDAFRRHVWYADSFDWLIEAAELAAPLPIGVVQHRAHLKAMLLTASQHHSSSVGGFRMAIQNLFQNSMAVQLEDVSEAVRNRESVVPSRIPIDGPVFDAEGAARYAELPVSLASLELDIGTLWYLVNRNKAEPLPCPLPPNLEVPQYVISWPAYGLAPIPRVTLPICRETCKPYVKGWKESAEIIYGAPPEKLISMTRAFVLFVMKYNAFPSRCDFMIFVYNRYREKNPTMPAAFEQFVDEVLEDYAGIVDIGVTEFLSRVKASCKESDRTAMETGMETRISAGYGMTSISS